MTYYLMILGRKSELAFLELQTVLGRTLAKKQRLGFDRVEHTVITATRGKLDPIALIRILGGSVKIGILGTKATTKDFMEKLTNVLRNEAIGKAKLSFGISLVGNPNPNQRFLVPRELKDKLSKEGIITRYVLPTKSDELTSAQVALGEITEVYVVWKDSEIEIAKTVAVQDFEGFAKRDYQRPYADPKGGMLPPKIARQMLNLAFPRPPTASDWILDPFCGTGTIAMEAMMLGLNSLSSDLVKDKVDGCKKNLSWLEEEEGMKGQWRVLRADATKVAEIIDQEVAAIVTEPFLGPPHPKAQNLKNLIKGLNKLYLGSLKNWRKCLKRKGRVVIAVPEIRIDHLTQRADRAIDMRENLGYTLVAGPIEYEREGAAVKRLIYVLEKE